MSKRYPHGRLVWAFIQDKFGNGKYRWAMVANDTMVRDRFDVIPVIVASTDTHLASVDDLVVINSRNGYDPKTGLSAHTVVVCTWSDALYDHQIEKVYGMVRERDYVNIMKRVKPR